MRNSLTTPLFNDASGGTLSVRKSGTNGGAPPTRVLSLIRIVFGLAAIAILARLAWIQRTLPDQYLSALTGTTVEYEWLPARDGRIVAESTVLAVDEERFQLQLHYRWLQSKPDPDWLLRQIRQHLTRDERRNPELVAAAENKLHQQRSDLRKDLAAATGLSEDELSARLAAIESRVQKIIDSVNRRSREENSTDSADDESRPGWLLQSLSAIRNALTTPPRREHQPRIIVREEETWHTVLEDIPREVAGRISDESHRFPGVRVVISTRRKYLQPDLATHVIGARTPRIEQELVAADDAAGLVEPTPADHSTGGSRSVTTVAPGPAPGLRLGRFGIERSYQSQLAGVPGLLRIVRDRQQRVVETELLREPVSGRDLTVTLDLPLQGLVEQLLEESLGDAERRLLVSAPELSSGQTPASLQRPALPPEPEFIPTGGCVLVMEADTGRLLVAASAPDFDLTMFTDGTPAQWKAVNGDTRRPFVARFTSMALPPGSTFKILTAIAGLESGTIRPDELFDCRGYLTTPDKHRCLIYRLHGKGHGPVTLQSALAQSCNVYFFDAAQRMGIGPLAEWSDRLEFGRPTGIDLPFEKSGTLPLHGAIPRSSSSSEGRDEGEKLGLAIGQSRLTVTPLQLARLVACVANGGWLVTPHVVGGDGSARQAGEHDTSPFPIRRHRVAGLSSDSLKAIRAGMKATVHDPNGTGFQTVRLPDIEIAGKTGTAENAPGKPDHAWFAGYVPADAPRYVIVVVLEHGGSGSRAAGPVVRETVRAMQAAGLL